MRRQLDINYIAYIHKDNIGEKIICIYYQQNRAYENELVKHFSRKWFRGRSKYSFDSGKCCRKRT